jgi:hypothetical protein
MLGRAHPQSLHNLVWNVADRQLSHFAFIVFNGETRGETRDSTLKHRFREKGTDAFCLPNAKKPQSFD